MIGIASRIRWFLFALFLIMAPQLSGAGTILVLGDSISAGYGLENPDRGWVGLLKQRLSGHGKAWQVVNESISGDTSAGGVARVGGLLEAYKPAILILELGGNDGLRGLAPARLRENLGTLISRSQAAGAKVLLVGMRIPPNYGHRYTALFESVFPSLAEEYGVAFVPFMLEGVGGHRSLMQADGLHPNSDAQVILLERVWEKLEPLL